MEIQEFFVGQLWDKGRITSRILSVAVVWKQGLLCTAVQQTFRRGIGSLHLIVNHAIVNQRAFFRFQLIMPALLAENLFLLIDIRMENRIHIHIHQILKILIITACHRIYRFVRIGHGV